MNKTVSIIGMGYVGIPVACFFAKAGYTVYGIDINKDKIASLKKGVYPIKGREPGMPELVKQVVKSGKLKATSKMDSIADSGVVIFCVDTPVDDKTKKPGYKGLKAALGEVGKRLKPETLVVMESTIAPLTMKNVIKDILEKESGLSADNNEFYLANAPERVMPGLLIDRLNKHPRVIGGWTPEAAQYALEVYSAVFPVEFEVTDSLTAELVKTAENTYRDVQIALANQIALVAESVGGDYWKVKNLVNKVVRRDLHDAGAGVGGHCIPKDSWLLINEARGTTPTGLIENTREINEFMPRHMVDLLSEGLTQVGKKLKGSKIALLGYAYSGNSDDSRHTPTQTIIEWLEEGGAKYQIHDPLAENEPHEINKDLLGVLKGADAAVLVTDHDEYKVLDWEDLKSYLNGPPVLIDGRNLFNQQDLRNLGFIYLGVGKPHVA